MELGKTNFPMTVQESYPSAILTTQLFLVMINSDCRLTTRNLGGRGLDILVPIALFSSLNRPGLGTRIEEPFDSRAKAPPAKRWERGYGN